MEEPFKFVPLEMTGNENVDWYISLYNNEAPHFEALLTNIGETIAKGNLSPEESTIAFFSAHYTRSRYEALIGECRKELEDYIRYAKSEAAKKGMNDPVFAVEKKDSPAEKFKKRNNECDIQLHLGYEKDGKEYVGVVIGRYDNLPKTDYIHVMFPENGEMNYIAFQPVSKEDAGKYKNCHKVAFYDGFGIEKSHFTLRSREVVDAIKEFAGGKEWSTYNLKRTSLGIYYIEKEKDNEQ